MKNYKICLLSLLLIQFSYQYCHNSQSIDLNQNSQCTCFLGFYNSNQQCFQCPNYSSNTPGQTAYKLSGCNTCQFQSYYMLQQATDTQNAVCAKCPYGTTLQTFNIQTTVLDVSACNNCMDGYQILDYGASASDGHPAKSAKCQRCPNNTFRNARLQSQDCLQCTSKFYGKIQQDGSVVCSLCPNNLMSNYFTQLPNGVTDCNICQKGYYNIGQSSNPPTCTKCPGQATSIYGGITIQQCVCDLNQYTVQIATQTTAAICQPCPNGSTRTSDIRLAGDESQCDYCQSGYYLLTPFQDSDGINPGKSANCQKCPNNSYSEQNISTSASVCSMCQLNYYMQTASDATTSAICLPCPNNTGTLDPVMTVGDANQCTVCQPGYYMIQPYKDGQQTSCKQCPTGSTTDLGINSICYCYDTNAFWSTDTSTCQCNPGYIGTPATSYNTQGCTPCPTGQYQSGASCKPCPPGSYQDSVGSTSCKSCTSGQFAAGTGNVSCSTCPTPMSTSLFDFSSCQCIDTSATFLNNQCICPSGYTGSPSSSAGTQGCTPCPAGQYSNSTTSGVCTSCPKGTYSTGTGNSDCLKCLSGTYSDSTGSTACTTCGSGSTNINDFSACTCYDSNASQLDSSKSCKCNSGFVGSPKASSSSQTGCTACTAGQEVNLNSGLCSQCAAGSFSNGSANQACTKCTSGQFASGTGNTSCSTCPDGSTSLNDFSGCKCIDNNAVSANNNCICKQGYGGTPSKTLGQTGCTACQPGYYSNASTQGQCVACPAGTFSSSSGSLVCQKCNEGQYAPGTGNTSCKSCGSTLTNNADFSGCKCIDINSNQPNSNASCVCNPGFVGSPKASSSSQTGCTACTAGQEVNLNSGLCSPCAAGSFSNGSANQACTKCTSGQFASGTGNTSCSTCPDGSTSLNDFSGCKCIDNNAVSANNNCICKQGYGGTPSKTLGQTGCTACQPGYYSDASTQGQCVACPAGTYSSSSSSLVCQKCNEGQYAPGTGNTSCKSCESTLTNNADFSGCQCIDPNSNQPNSNASCVCNPGYIGSPAATKNSQSVCTACPAGQFTDSGRCSPCPTKTYSNGTANDKCTPLEAGQYAIGTGNTSFKRCSSGSTNTEDFSGCKCYDSNAEAWTNSSNLCQCKANYYGDASKATDAQKSECVPCPNNQTSKTGAKSLQDCQSPQQDKLYQFSQILNVSVLILLIIFM